MLRSLSGENPNQHDMVLAQVEFAYNDLVNKTTSKSPFQIVYGWSLKGVIDLIQQPNLEERKSFHASDFEKNMQLIHE